MTYDPKVKIQPREKDVGQNGQPALRTFCRLIAITVQLAALQCCSGQAPTGQVQVDPNTLLLQAIQKSVWGPSLSCQVQQQTDMFNQQQIGIGHYCHSGSGEGQLELGMRYSTGRSQLYFEQISDGRMVWAWANDGQPPKRVYLDRIRPLLGSNPQASAAATLYLAVGGQPGLLRSLYHRYRWYKIYAGEADGKAVWEIIGTLRQTPASIAAQAPIDQRMIGQPANDLLTSDARVRLGRGGDLDLVPLRVEYIKRLLDEQGELQGHVTVSKIEYTDIQVGARLDESKFAFQDHADNPIDETSDYMPTIPLAGSEQPLVR